MEIELVQEVNRIVEHITAIYGNAVVCTNSNLSCLAPELNAPMVFSDSIFETSSGGGNLESFVYVIPLGAAIENIEAFTPESQALIRDWMFRIMPPAQKRVRERQQKKRSLWVTQKGWVRR